MSPGAPVAPRLSICTMKTRRGNHIPLNSGLHRRLRFLVSYLIRYQRFRIGTPKSDLIYPDGLTFSSKTRILLDDSSIKRVTGTRPRRHPMPGAGSGAVPPTTGPIGSASRYDCFAACQRPIHAIVGCTLYGTARSAVPHALPRTARRIRF